MKSTPASSSRLFVLQQCAGKYQYLVKVKPWTPAPINNTHTHTNVHTHAHTRARTHVHKRTHAHISFCVLEKHLDFVRLLEMRLTCPVEGQAFQKPRCHSLFSFFILHSYISARQNLLSNDKKNPHIYQEKKKIEEAHGGSVKVCLKFPEGNKKSFSLRCELFLFIRLLGSVSPYILFVGGLSLHQTEGRG